MMRRTNKQTNKKIVLELGERKGKTFSLQQRFAPWAAGQADPDHRAAEEKVRVQRTASEHV
jgi:hypothetical protein